MNLEDLVRDNRGREIVYLCGKLSELEGSLGYVGIPDQRSPQWL